MLWSPLTLLRKPKSCRCTAHCTICTVIRVYRLRSCSFDLPDQRFSSVHAFRSAQFRHRCRTCHRASAAERRRRHPSHARSSRLSAGHRRLSSLRLPDAPGRLPVASAAKPRTDYLRSRAARGLPSSEQQAVDITTRAPDTAASRRYPPDNRTATLTPRRGCARREVLSSPGRGIDSELLRRERAVSLNISRFTMLAHATVLDPKTFVFTSWTSMFAFERA